MNKIMQASNFVANSKYGFSVKKYDYRRLELGVFGKKLSTFIFLVFSMVPFFTVDAQTSNVNYTVSTAEIPNPERGFYNNSGLFSSSISVLTESYLTQVGSDKKQTLHWRYYYLDAFMGSPISTAFLDTIKYEMSLFRKLGMKAIVRFAYKSTYTGSSPYNDSPSKAWILTHIQQLKPLIQQNTDVIFTLQNGFWGSFGENFYSDNFGCVCSSVSTTQWADRKQVTDSLLAALPSRRFLSLRYPLLKSRYFGFTMPTDSLTLATAHDGTIKSRIGYNIDCFLASSTDYSYTNLAIEKPYIVTESKYTIMGGETCGDDPTYTNCTNAKSELAKQHWTYMNDGFEPSVISRWQSEGCYQEIRDRLGYRLSLNVGTYTNSVKPGGEFNYSFSLSNTGYAAPVNPRGVEIVLKSKTDNRECKYQLSDDPRYWFPGTHTISGSIGIPAGYIQDTYDVFLNLPDPEPSLYGNPDYSIQLANTGVWNSLSGYNDLGFDLVVTSSNSGVSYSGSNWFNACNTNFCPGTGSLSLEVWHNQNTYGGVSVVNWASIPDSTGSLTCFKDPGTLDNENYFGSRISGYLCPPSTGNYTFYIYGSDPCQLWLSTDNTAANKVKIAEVPSGGWTNPDQWNKYASQKSVTMPLVGGKLYYIESLYKENNNLSSLGVGWITPGSSSIKILDAANLAPNTLVALPVDFIDVTVKKELGASSATLHWSTASAHKNNYFVVQKSIDGYSFVDMGDVNSRGSTDRVSLYSWVDYDLNSEMVYYRIKQVDFDGRTSFSKIVNLKNEGGRVMLFPNPVSNELGIKFADVGKMVSVSIYDVLGVKVYTKNCRDCEQGMLLDVSQLSPGVYIVGVDNGHSMVYEKIRKE